MVNLEKSAKGMDEKIAVIACGVLALDMRDLKQKPGQDVQLHFLPGGLHASPDKLRIKLQERIDAIDAVGEVSRIIIGYGLCGHGTSGICSRNIPLIIPRVHDCIALFLGSDDAYREQFGNAPGTYYLSAGWVEENDNDQTGMGSAAQKLSPNAATPHSMDETTDENEAFVENFMQGWTRNYTRAAYIDTGVGGGKEHYARKAEEMAHKYGWEYERLAGTHGLLVKAMTCKQTTDDMLLVPPMSKTDYDALKGRLICVSQDQCNPGTADHALGKTCFAFPPRTQRSRKGIGIGIDAGGTYTDAVIYDFEKDMVVQKNKGLTTHWDYRHGIREALSGLSSDLCSQASLVALSTTIATNAIVEGRGQSVGLIVMPPCGWSELEGFQHSPVATIKGQMSIDGSEIEPVDENEVRSVARNLIEQQGVTAFAVGGYASHVNAAHELMVKKAIQTTTGLICTCSHELSNSLHYRVRAETAALNARIIPCLEELLQNVTTTLQEQEIRAPVMVVRSDGSFMNLASACERPLETMLSGPAASVAGAGWLADLDNGLIVDIGGTTTDSAILVDGEVEINAEGASIGGWQTHIKALDLQTIGLGGDSCVRSQNEKITIGPDRVVPLCWLGAEASGMAKAFLAVLSSDGVGGSKPEDWIFLIRTRKTIDKACTPRETKILDHLAPGPMTPVGLAQALELPHPAMLSLSSLLEHQLIAYSGFTPTDALHITGKQIQWNASVSELVAERCATPNQTAIDWANCVISAFQDRLAYEISFKALSRVLPSLDREHALTHDMLVHLFASNEAKLPGLQLSLPWPIVGIGAPAKVFVPLAGEKMHAEVVIPEHADVANAVGAIVGTVSIRQTIRVHVDEKGIFRVSGASSSPRFSAVEDATDWIIRHLKQVLTERAYQAGCSDPAIQIQVSDNMVPSKDGVPIFVGREVHGHAQGVPSL